jgi:hypothetical protein
MQTLSTRESIAEGGLRRDCHPIRGSRFGTFGQHPICVSRGGCAFGLTVLAGLPELPHAAWISEADPEATTSYNGGLNIF